MKMLRRWTYCILSETINMKVQREKEQEEEIRQSYNPTRLPFQGTASYNGQEKELDGNPIAKFYNANGISIVATANGTKENGSQMRLCFFKSVRRIRNSGIKS